VSIFRLLRRTISRSKRQEIIMKASSLSIQAAVVMVVIGMAWGIFMGISKDHSTMPAHAHLNLVGWASLFLIGVYYRLNPALDVSRIAKIQVWVWVAGTIVMTIGVALLHSGRGNADPIAAIGSLILLADVLLFAWLVFSRERSAKLA
jgi:hypothetical protein